MLKFNQSGFHNQKATELGFTFIFGQICWFMFRTLIFRKLRQEDQVRQPELFRKLKAR